MKKMTINLPAIFFAIILVLLPGCGGGGSAPNPQSAIPNPKSETVTIAGKVVIGGVDDYSGVIVIAEKAAGGVTARVQRMMDEAGKPDPKRITARQALDTPGVYTTETDKTGNYKFENIPEGKYSVSAYKESTLAAAPRIVEATAGQTVTVDFELVATGRISGSIIVGKAAGSTVIMAYLEGTSFAGYPDGNGNYTISNVPVGTYNIVFVVLGAKFGTHSGVVVAAGATTNNDLTSFTLACFNDSDCDDGNTNTIDICTNPYTEQSVCSHETSICGNGVVEIYETCDDGGESATCDADCSAATCGDYVTNTTAGETCDDGGYNGQSGYCNATCTGTTAAVCGNGMVESGETCDDGANNGQPGYCNAMCSGTTASVCGNGVVESGETCDDGANNGQPNYCNATCNGTTPLTGTYVSGIINSNTTWTLANSPYIVNGLIQVASGVTLTIQPGVTVMYAGVYTIEVHGAIVANGTASETITFTSTTSGTSSGATMINLTSDVNLNNVGISYAKFEYGAAAILINSGTGVLTLDYLTVSNNNGDYGTIQNNSSNFDISNSTFSNNASGSTICSRAGNVNVTNVTFTGNTSYSSNACHYNYVGTIFNTGTMVVSNSTFTNNSGSTGYWGSGGVTNLPDDMGPGGTMTVSNSTFTNNTGGNASAIYGTVTVSGSTFNGNSGCAVGGGNSSITNSNFTNNSCATSGAVNISYSTISSTGGTGTAVDSPASVTYSVIYGYAVGIQGAPTTFHHNNIYGNTQYNLKLTGSGNVTAANNWWGTTDTNTINAKIYDKNDNLNLGTVTYTPILNAAEPTAGDPD